MSKLTNEEYCEIAIERFIERFNARLNKVPMTRDNTEKMLTAEYDETNRIIVVKWNFKEHISKQELSGYQHYKQLKNKLFNESK